jgi:hypothetical protein
MTVGQQVAVAFGVLLVAVAVVDLFLTVFNYDGFTFLAGRFQRVVWRTIRAAGGLMPRRSRAAALSLGSGFMLPATVFLWLSLEIFGFALIYWAGLRSGGMTSSHGVGRGLGGALYMSAGDISTLTFGDVIASSGFWRAAVDVQAMLGLGTFTLALGYLVTTYGVLANLDSLHSTVRRNAAEPVRPSSILVRHYRGGEPSELPDLLESLSEKLESYDEGLRRYPVVYYFHTRRTERSVPRVVWTLGELLSLIRWGLPADDPMTDDPWLAALLDQYVVTVRRLQRSFVGPHPLPESHPVERAVFDRSYIAGGSDGPVGSGSSGEQAVARFLDMQGRARAAADLTPPPDDDLEQAYQRYCEWHSFTHLRDLVLERISDRLGYPLGEVTRRSDEATGDARNRPVAASPRRNR